MEGADLFWLLTLIQFSFCSPRADFMMWGMRSRAAWHLKKASWPCKEDHIDCKWIQQALVTTTFPCADGQYWNRVPRLYHCAFW